MRIALDIDDVLAGFASGVHDSFNKKVEPHNHWHADESTGQLILKKDETGKVVGYTQEYLDKCEHNPDFWYHLEPISLPVDVSNDVVCYITSSPKNMVQVRIDWLKKHGFPTLPVIHSKNKVVTMKNLEVGILLDDKSQTVYDVNQAGLQGFHFQPWYSTLRGVDSFTHLSHFNNFLSKRYSK